MSAELRVDRLGERFGTRRPARRRRRVRGARRPKGVRLRCSARRRSFADVGFRVAAGEIVVLLGPSGCGKTTTLGCIAGLEHPTTGSISIGGGEGAAPERGVHVPPRLRNIGMVFQSYAVWPHMTVQQNVNYPLRHRKV